MIRKVFAVILFLYALWQILTALNVFSSGQGLGQIVWALLAVLAGLYLWKRPNKAKT